MAVVEPDASALGDGTDLSGRSSYLERAFAVLAAFNGPKRLTLADVTRRVALPKTTVHRLMHELTSLGALESDGRTYGVGLRVFEIASSVHCTRLCEAASPVLHDLSRLTDRSALVSILDGTDVVFLERVHHRSTQPVVPWPGLRVPAHCCAPGKVLLAAAPDSAVEALIAGGLRPRASRTVVEGDVLRRELERVKKLQVATDRDELARGLSSIAVPVPDLVQGGVAGAISLCTRPGDDLEYFVTVLRRVAQAISRRAIQAV
jgi:DNA-binding IclR family transcriptional regulator